MHAGVKRNIRQKFSNACYYCGIEMVEPTEEYLIPKEIRLKIATIEHLTRRVDGGVNRIHNMVVACLCCNSHRGEYHPEIWRLIHRQVISLRNAYKENPNNIKPTIDEKKYKKFKKGLKLLALPVELHGKLCRNYRKFYFMLLKRNPTPRIPLKVLEHHLVSEILKQHNITN